MLELAGEEGGFSLQSGGLNIEYTLTNGQLFRWRQTTDGWWDVVVGVNLLRLKLERIEGDIDYFRYETYPQPADFGVLSTFMRLDVDLPTLYASWESADPYLSALSRRFAGLRIVKQHPEECLLSFMCSTANFIPRIMKAIGIIARTWGQSITAPDGKVLTHSFPASSVIAELDPMEVSEKTGLEWRAANLVKVAQQIARKGPNWLEDFEKMDYASARGELMRIDGVGPKISDCVCLFALAKDQAVPVDTHVWQLTRERYLPGLRGKSPGSAGYAQVLSYFQSHFEKAGWAQQYLFYDHLLESRARNPRRA